MRQFREGTISVNLSDIDNMIVFSVYHFSNLGALETAHLLGAAKFNHIVFEHAQILTTSLFLELPIAWTHIDSRMNLKNPWPLVAKQR